MPLDSAAKLGSRFCDEVRLKLAQRDSVPAFCVMHDRVLMELARAAPANTTALLKISGIGPKIAAKYGDAFLTALRNGRAQQ